MLALTVIVVNVTNVLFNSENTLENEVTYQTRSQQCSAYENHVSITNLRIVSGIKFPIINLININV